MVEGGYHAPILRLIIPALVALLVSGPALEVSFPR
jgi:hypothetical protein